MMKKLFILLLFLISVPLFSQGDFNPVSWAFDYEDKGNNNYEIILTATVELHSHIYSMDLPEDGPIPTSVHFNESSDFTLQGKVEQIGKAEEVFDEGFNMKVTYFSDKVVYKQRITSDKSSFTVSGAVNFMACDNKQCSPPKDVEFSIDIKGTDAAVAVAPSEEMTEGIDDTKKEEGLLAFFFGALLLGFLGVLTPCVYPMIPMTVAFFTQGADNKGKTLGKALVFGVTILLLYSSLGIIVSLTSAGAGFANALSTHWIPNLIFFILFMVFAASFFGAFEIVLPGKWVNSADSKVDKGGIVAAFFLGLTTVLVSFSCVGPLVGGLLVEAASGSVLRPTIGMFAFGLAFAIPFTLFALFPSLMDKLPKSGGWLNSIKVVLAFVMLAFGLKFLSKIDEVYTLGIITRDIFIAIWIVLFTLLGLYLLGKIKFRHDSDVQYIGVFRLLLVVAVFSFVVYLIPGLFGASLKGIADILPSKSSQQFDIVTDKVGGSEATTPLIEMAIAEEPVKFADKLSHPYGLDGFFEYNQGLDYAKKVGKPVLLDFKGHACSNCKKMEAKVWSDQEVLKRLRENFVIIELYIDDPTRLPESDWVNSVTDGKVKKTIGKVNEDIEITRFKTNAIPLHVILDSSGNQLGSLMAYTADKEEYIKWLDEGVRLYSSR